MMNRDLYGNGNPGLVGRVAAFITKHETQEEEREKQHAQNRIRLNLIIAILGALAGYLVFFKGHF